MKTKKQANLLKRFLVTALSLAMVLSLSGLTAFADGEDTGSGTKGSITIQNATIGETYTVYKLFDAVYGDSYTDENGNTVTPTTYVATEEQKIALEAMEGNVFVFTAIYDAKGEVSGYQVTIGTTTDDNENTVSYTDEEVVAFVKGLIFSVNGFPGAVKAGSETATSGTVTFSDLTFGYYFVTSSLGTVLTIDTLNPDATVNDKNTSEPNPDNDPNPNEPEKDVVGSSGQSIDGTTVAVGDTLTYKITYTNDGDYTEDESGTLASVVIKDAAPEGTKYSEDSAAFKVYDESGEEVTLSDGKATTSDGIEITAKVEVDVNTGEITWTFTGVPEGYTVEASFSVTVQESAKDLDQNCVKNTADVTINDQFTIKTNKVKNYVPDETDPVKDVQTGSADVEGTITYTDDSGNTVEVKVGDYLKYSVAYKNTQDSTSGSNEKVVITDAAPTGTVYVKDSATLVATDAEESPKEIEYTVSVAADGTITWTVEELPVGYTVTAYFEVEVTEDAYGITDRTIRNTAEVQINDDSSVKTNEVENPVNPPEGETDTPDPNPGKVIVEADGTETQVSTGSFGDTVTFDLGIDAVNKVADEDDNPEQVTEYYIYDIMGPGFDLGELQSITISGTEYTITKGNTDSTTGVTTWTATCAEGTTATFYTTVDSDGNTIINGIIPWATSSEDSDGNTTYSPIYPNCEVHLTYTATINTDAEIAGDGNVNKFNFSYNTASGSGDDDRPDPESPTYPSEEELENGSEEKTTTTYTYALAIQKYSKDTGEALAGAEFTLTDNYGNPVYAVPVTGADGNVLYYNYTSGSNAEGAVSVFTTNADGQIIIKGVDVGTYTFTETKAPDGYMLLTESTSVEAKMDSSSTTYNKEEWTVTRYFEQATDVTEENFDSLKGELYTKSGNDMSGYTYTLVGEEATYDSDTTYYRLTGESTESSVESGSVTLTFPVNAQLLEIKNTMGSELPSTGGMGTTILYVIGIILILGAGITLVVRRRLRAEK